MTYKDGTSIFFNTLFPQLPEHGRILIWRTPGRLSDFCSNADDAAATADKVGKTHDAYFSCGIQPDHLKRAQRAKSDQVLGITSFWADMDFAGEGHAEGSKYPPNYDACMTILDVELGIKPSMIVHSGNGIHAYWILDEPWIFKDDADRDKAASLMKQWQKNLQRLCGLNGWSMDSTFDLGRVLRPAGTFNRKDKKNPKPISIRELNEYRYPVDALESILPPEDEEPRLPVADKTAAVTMEDAPNFKANDPFDLLPDIVKEYVTTDSGTKQWWNRQRHDMSNTTPSSYDMVVCNIGLYNGWSDGDIAKAMFAWRTRYNEKPDKIYERDDYVKRTLDGAKATFKFNRPEAKTGDVVDKVVSNNGHDKPDPLAISKQVISDGLHGPKCVGVVQYRISNTVHNYHMLVRWEDNTVSDIDMGGSDTVRSNAKLSSRLWDENIELDVDKKDWPRFLAAIRIVAEVVESDEVRDTFITKKYIKAYFKSRSMLVDQDAWFNAYQRNDPFVRDGNIYIDSEHFRTFAYSKYKVAVSDGEMRKRLMRVGFREVVLDVPEPYDTKWTVLRLDLPKAYGEQYLSEAKLYPTKLLETSQS